MRTRNRKFSGKSGTHAESADQHEAMEQRSIDSCSIAFCVSRPRFSGIRCSMRTRLSIPLAQFFRWNQIMHSLSTLFLRRGNFRTPYPRVLLS